MRTSLFWRRLACASAAAALLALAPLQAARAAQECSIANATPANRIKRLQTFMMVAALQCRAHQEMALAAKYNSFVKRYGGELQKSGGVLIREFKQLYGRSYQSRMDSMVTSVANDAARQAIWVENWCDQMSDLGERLSRGTGFTLLEAADKLPAQPLPGAAPAGCASNVASRDQTKER